MSTTTTGSPNITTLDSKIVASLCDGYFYVDVTPSVWIGTGYNNIQGASVRITNPVGVIINNYITSGFDIYPPMTSIFSLAIPTSAGNYQYGTYTIDVRLTDANGDTWTVTKYVNLCPPDSNNKTKNEGCLNASIKGNCRTGKTIIILNSVPTYKGVISTTQVNTLSVEYPTASGLPILNTTIGSFSIPLFEGQYKLTGNVCATYSYGDEVYFKVKYKVKCEKIIRCIIDECCVNDKIQELNLKIKSDCTTDQKNETASTIMNALWLLKAAELAQNCGDDPSDLIGDLEILLGCTCTCNCNEGTPIIGSGEEVGYIYRGLITQLASAAPTEIIGSLNSITISWSRTSTGNYIGVLSGSFTPLTEDNTFIILGSGFNSLSPGDSHFIKAGYYSANSIIIITTDSAGSVSDSILNNVAIEISILS